MEYIKELTGIGLSESEAGVYLANLQLGPATVIQIAEKSGMTRQMAYRILPKLIEKGLIKEVFVKKTRRYQIVALQSLQDFAENSASKVKAIIPDLQSLIPSVTPAPTLHVYNNAMSMREWYRHFIREATADDELLLLVTNRAWLKTDQHYLKKFIDFKTKLKISDKIIAPDNEDSRAYAKMMEQPYAEYRFLKKSWKSSSEKWIWRNTVSLLVTREYFTQLIVIESQELADLERASFYSMWNTLPN